MIRYFLQGFLLGISYVAPIGMQNLYVINSAITASKRAEAFRTAFITIFFDISLALTCFWGVGTIIQKSKVLRSVVLLVGCIVVIYIGISLIRSKPDIDEKTNIEKT